MLAAVAAVVLLTCVQVDVRVAANDLPTKEELTAITERGRMLSGYDEACWHASDAVVETKPKEGSVSRYIARKSDNGWVVSFGRLDTKKDKFLVAYEAMQTDGGKEYTVKELNPPREDDKFLRSAAKSIDTCLKEFRGEKRPHNVAVLPADKDQFWVYIFPAPTQPGVWPLGGDTRFKVSSDGTKIVETRQLHKTILELRPPDTKGEERAVASMHTHVLSNLPEDTDVFHVLTRKPSVLELITSERFVYEIGVDGAIKYLGTAEEFLKKK